MTTIYLNRKNIDKIHELRELWGPERTAQTNSRQNGNFLDALRLYPNAGDQRHPERAIYTITDTAGLDDALNRLRAAADNL